jgi:hypothetical protein
MAKQGREIVDFDWDKFNAILQFNPTKVMCAEILGVSEDIIEFRLRDHFQTTFGEYKQRKMSNTKLKLQQKAIQMGLAGDRTMLIFSLKNLCGWSDTPMLAPEDDSLEFVE